jgi:ParB family transcriptional regulator, chromosome partitioning protein
MNSNLPKKEKMSGTTIVPIVPEGVLRRLKVFEIKPSASNPRFLFDPGPLHDLKESIRVHGVLVPITVYSIKGQDKFGILDGERRYRCCVELEKEGIELTIPANIVEPPNKIAGILYMFSIHNFRESWELMPTALSLKIIMESLGETDTKPLSKLTGLGEAQIERCKVLLSYPDKYQMLSLDPDPATRIPSNFWIEAYPILELCEKELPTLYKRLGRDGICDLFVEKYRAGYIKSVIHFRRILEAYDVYPTKETQKTEVVNRLETFITTAKLETRKAFDEFVVDNRRIQSSINACQEFVTQLERNKLEHVVENKEDLINALRDTQKYIEELINKLEGNDAPRENYVQDEAKE